MDTKGKILPSDGAIKLACMFIDSILYEYWYSEPVPLKLAWLACVWFGPALQTMNVHSHFMGEFGYGLDAVN